MQKVKVKVCGSYIHILTSNISTLFNDNLGRIILYVQAIGHSLYPTLILLLYLCMSNFIILHLLEAYP